MRGRGLLLLVMTIPTQVKSQSESHKNSFTFLLPPGSCIISSRSNSIPGELSYLCGSTLITDKHVVCVLFATKIFILLSQINPKPQNIWNLTKPLPADSCPLCGGRTHASHSPAWGELSLIITSEEITHNSQANSHKSHQSSQFEVYSIIIFIQMPSWC